jgi:anti-sigma factor RsiW
VTNSQDESCFTDFALDEYVAGRLDPDVRAEVESHTRSCDPCREAVALLRAESEFLRHALAQTGGESLAGDLHPETLARYLDGSLDPSDSAAVEHRLLRDPKTLHQLNELRAEVAAALAGRDVVMPIPEPVFPRGEILRMPQRTRPPLVVWRGERMFGSGAG